MRALPTLGPGAEQLTVEPAAGTSFTSAIITVDAGQTVSLAGLTIANGNAGGISNAGTLTLANTGASNNDNSVQFAAGGITNNGVLTVRGCTLSGNSAPAPFGLAVAILNQSTLTFTGSTLSANSRATVGGIANDGSGATLTVSDNALSSNLG